MYIPRGKLLALVTIVVAASLVTATGAFSSVQTERTAEVKVAGDKNAYLGLNGTSPYAEEGNDGKLKIGFNEEHETKKGGQGVNPESITSFDDVFAITNQGTQDVLVTAESSGGDVISLYDSKNSNDINKVSISPGESISVGVKIDASDKTKTSDDITEDITIEAASEDAADVDTSLPENGADSSGNSSASNNAEPDPRL